MTDVRPTRARISLLTGFLGAGKTSWLRHHLQHGVLQDAIVVVNEAAAQPVDNAMLSHAKHLSTLSGGCACCERKLELIALLQRLCEHPPLAKPANHSPARIVVEASGLADPAPIIEAIRGDPLLSQSIEIGEAITIIDARNGAELLEENKLARRQVGFADCLIVSKLDEANENEARRLLEALRWLNPRAPIFGANRGVEVALPSFEETMSDPFPGRMDEDGPPIAAVQLDVATIGWPTFSVWLSALLYARGRDVLRVKGVIRAPAGRLLVQAVQGRVGAPEILPETEEDGDGVIVFIGRGFTHDDLTRSLRAFADQAQPSG